MATMRAGRARARRTSQVSATRWRCVGSGARPLELREQAGVQRPEHELCGLVPLEHVVADVVPPLLERLTVHRHRHRPIADAVAGLPLHALLVELLPLLGRELVPVEAVDDLLRHELERGVGPPERLGVEGVVALAVAVIVPLIVR
jgi:hypothetical protein